VPKKNAINGVSPLIGRHRVGNARSLGANVGREESSLDSTEDLNIQEEGGSFCDGFQTLFNSFRIQRAAKKKSERKKKEEPRSRDYRD